MYLFYMQPCSLMSIPRPLLGLPQLQDNKINLFCKKIINNRILIFYFSAPPSFEIKTRKQTALKGESTVLQCEAKGEKPIGNKGNLPFYSAKQRERNL